jgi:hypothetical protein
MGGNLKFAIGLLIGGILAHQILPRLKVLPAPAQSTRQQAGAATVADNFVSLCDQLNPLMREIQRRGGDGLGAEDVIPLGRQILRLT